MKTFGIYKIENKITNDYYIGSTIESFEKRKAKHISSYYGYLLRNKIKTHPLLYNAINKYGIDNFEFVILYRFTTRKEKTHRVLLELEEKLINQLNPKYNVCKKPTLSGCPNLGRKLSEEWKENIRIRSSEYTHSPEVLKKVTRNNRKNSSIYLINNEFKGSLIECASYYKVHQDTILNRFKNRYDSEIIKTVVKLKSQKKKIKLFTENGEIIFNSFSECDKFFNMWRGFTSTQVVRNEQMIKNYKYEVLENEIV